MKELEEIKGMLASRKELLTERYFVKEISIFGSFVREENTASSDIDILVDFYRPISLFSFLDLENYLNELLGIRVDLVSKKSLKPFIGKRIMEEKILI